MLARLVAVIASLTVCATAAAAAERPVVGLRLHVEASAGCPDQGAFLAELQARGVVVRDAPEGASAATLQVELSTESGGAIGRLTFRPPEGPLEGEALHREVSAADCESVAEGLALVAAVILNPPAPAPDPQPALVVAPPSAPSAAPPPDPSAAPQTAPAPGKPAPATHVEYVPVSNKGAPSPDAGPPGRLRLGGGAALVVASGVGPGAALIAGGFLDVDLPSPLARWSARLAVGRAISRSDPTLYGTAQFDLTDFRLEPCFHVVGSTTLRLRACALFEGGVLEAQANHVKDGGLLEVGLSVRPSWTLRNGVVLGLSAGAAVPVLPRYEFYFSNTTQTAYKAEADLSASGEFSIGVPFW